MSARHSAFAATMLLVLNAVPGAAQTNIHVSGGLNWANLNDGPPDAVMRLVAGAALSFPVSERFSLQLGADYSQRGFGVRIAGASFSADLDYLEANALLDAALVRAERASLHILAGPTFGLNLSCKLTFVIPNLPAPGPVDCDDPMASGDLPSGSDGGIVGGLRAGVGVFDRLDVTIGAFYNFGVFNILRSTPPSNAMGRSRTMTARAGIAYRIG